MKRFLQFFLGSFFAIILIVGFLDSTSAPLAKAVVKCNAGGELGVITGTGGSVAGSLNVPGARKDFFFTYGCPGDLSTQEAKTKYAQENNLLNNDNTLNEEKARQYLKNNIQMNDAEIDALLPKLKQAAADFVKTGSSTSDCGINSPLSFILCPLNQIITDTLNTVIQTIAAVLAVNSESFFNNAGLRAAQQSFLNIANSFFVLLFLFIIFANFVTIPGLDNYTIKKLLPKLIAAIVIAQFAFFMCIAILDLSNIAGNTIPNTLVKAFYAAPGSSNNLSQAEKDQLNKSAVAFSINQAFNPLSASNISNPAGSATALISSLGLFHSPKVAICSNILDSTNDYHKYAKST